MRVVRAISKDLEELEKAQSQRPWKGQHGLTLSFQQAEGQSDPEQAIRKKEKETLCGSQLSL